MSGVANDYTPRDYSLTGAESAAARARGLASATWYSSPVPRPQIKALMRREDGPAIRDTLVWFAAIAATGALGVTLWGSWWGVPVFALYGVLTCSASDSRWHECGHGTAFKTRWMNDVVYQVACFWVLRQPTVWRWSHARHHTDTIIVGRDPEIAVPRPPSVVGILLNVFAIRSGIAEWRSVLRNAAGRISARERDFIPESEWPRVVVEARVWLGIIATVIGISIWVGSILPLMLVGLNSFYGAWMFLMFGLTQHAGLAEDVLDHRLNTRTVYMNPFFRFIYWNMNYHIEHHMFPMVPYHALPKLHEAMRADTPAPYRGVIAAYREIIPTVLRQRREPGYYVRRELPATARPVAAFDAMATAAE